MASAAPMRAKLNTMSAIAARLRRQIGVVTPMLSSSVRAWAGSSTGVLPWRTTCDGPRTETAGLTAITWLVTSQSNRRRIAALARLPRDAGGNVKRLDSRDQWYASFPRTRPERPPQRAHRPGAWGEG